MRIYVATKFTNYLAAREAMAMLAHVGHSITYDWTKHVDQGEPDQRACAIADLDGVARADAVLLLAVPQMQGAWLEVGYALALGKRVAVSGHIDPWPVFIHHPLMMLYRSTEAAILGLRGREKK